MHWKHRLRIREEEEARMQARDDIAHRQHHLHNKQIEKILKYQAYVNLHGGPQRAFLRTFKKWMIGVLIFAIYGFVAVLFDEKGMFEALKGAVSVIIFGTALALGRAFYVLKTAQVG